MAQMAEENKKRAVKVSKVGNINSPGCRCLSGPKNDYSMGKYSMKKTCSLVLKAKFKVLKLYRTHCMYALKSLPIDKMAFMENMAQSF